MPDLYRVKARWSGFTGAPGFTVLHFRDFSETSGGSTAATAAGAQAAATKVKNFFEAIRANLPSVVIVAVDAEVDVIDDATGDLRRSFTVTPPASTVGSATGAFATAVGAVINWRTDGVRNGRRVRGRSFIVPLASGAFTADGQLGAGVVTQITTAATALADPAGSPDLFIFARPTSAGATDGVSHFVTNANVPKMGAVLTSRRD